MAIDGGETHIGAIIQANERERAEFARSLADLTPDDLAGLAEDCCFKVGYIDIIIEELATRLLNEQNELTGQLLKQAKEHAELCRKLATEILTSDSPIKHQTILPAEATVLGNDGTEHAFRFSALQLALTGKLTREDKVVAALKANGINCSVSQGSADGSSFYYTMRKHAGVRTLERPLGPSALVLGALTEAAQATQQNNT
jgi:hypothetical protein